MIEREGLPPTPRLSSTAEGPSFPKNPTPDLDKMTTDYMASPQYQMSARRLREFLDKLRGK